MKEIINLKKAQSHLSKVIKMIENGENIINITQQNLAVIGLLKSVNKILMKDYLEKSLPVTMKISNIKKEEIIQEIMRISNLVNK